MERIRTDIKSGGGKLYPIINHDAGPTWMKRTVGKGGSGSGNSLPPSNRAKYGLAEGADVVRMSRKGGTGPSGKNWKLTHTGPTRMPRSDKGSASHDGPTYGVRGVDGSGGGGYGVGGI